MYNRNSLLMTIDAITAAVTLYLSFLIRFEFLIPNEYIISFLRWTLIFAFSQIVVFNFSDLYARLWRYTSLFDLYAILGAVFFSTLLSTSIITFTGTTSFPRSVMILYFIFNSILVITTRLSVRIYFSHYHHNSDIKRSKPLKKLLLIGAGKTGEKISREIRSTSRNKYIIVGFVDDNKEKHGALINGKKIFCSIRNIPNLKIKYDELLITAPSATGDQMRAIVDICKRTGKRYKTVPGINEIIDGEISMAVVRDVNYSDLLGRAEVKLDMNSIESMIRGKRILITGAGGSIGSELVKQCLSFNPAEIICLDTSEEKIYKLDLFSKKINESIVMKTVLATINSKKQLEKVFIDNRPHIVLHAAAYKHVPIQELHPWNAVQTNLGGTLNLVELSDKFSVDKFVLVSTDKAVNPVNVMGATKRAAEKLIQSFNEESKTTYMAVRFGNVLGSSGSAIPTFQDQINKGGPLTITHPEMTRYFMSIQEASQLILQCGALGKDGEIFLLQMGKPIKIVNMAKDLIRLSGLEPEIDIPIVYTGLRPGEKLYEELQMFDEQKVTTSHKKIMILKDKNPKIPWTIFKERLIKLIQSSSDLDSEKIQIVLKQILPAYSPRQFNPSRDSDRKSFIQLKAEA